MYDINNYYRNLLLNVLMQPSLPKLWGRPLLKVHRSGNKKSSLLLKVLVSREYKNVPNLFCSCIRLYMGPSAHTILFLQQHGNKGTVYLNQLCPANVPGNGSIWNASPELSEAGVAAGGAASQGTTHTHTHTHTHLHTHNYKHTHTDTHLHTHSHSHTHTYTHTHTLAHTQHLSYSKSTSSTMSPNAYN